MSKSKITEDKDFPSNSRSQRIVVNSNTGPIDHIDVGKKKATKTIKGRALRRKKTLTESISQTFFGEDTRNVVQYIMWDVLIPAAKNTIQEMISSGIEMLLFGETHGHARSRKDRDKGRSIVSYGSFYRGRDDESRSRPSRSRGRFALDDIVFRRGDEAGEVLEGLLDLLDQYEQVTVADFYELAGVEGSTWADQKWGWENLSKAHCTHTRGGYAIVLPEPIELD